MTSGTTRRRASIIHGYAASPEDHWFGWLGQQLEADGFSVTIARLPSPQEPDAVQWAAAVSADVGVPDEGSIIVAHSLGCLAVLRHLRSLPAGWRLGTLVLVSGFVDPLPALPELDGFIGDGCDVEGISAYVDQLTIIRSDADPLVSPAHTDRLAGLLGTSAAVVPGAGHFLAADGVEALPEALEAITSDRSPSQVG
ncbi:RBBP9/YdeN family alpha/beta hydrolase [Kribbella endophytica]